MPLLKRSERVSQKPRAGNFSPVNILAAGNADLYKELKTRIHQRIIDEFTASENGNISGSQAGSRLLEGVVAGICNEELDQGIYAVPPADREKIIAEMIDEVLGYGPIQSLLKDDGVSEILVNGPEQVYAERNGKLLLTDIKFRDNAHVMNVIERIVAPIGRRIDESCPLVDARLPDGSRVNAIIPPLALKGPCLSIRKFSTQLLTVDKLLGFNTLTENMMLFLKACVEGRLNIIISGGTSSGKTTTLNILSSFISNDERIITIEDAAELQLQQQHVVTLETRPVNIEGTGAITMRDLVRNSLRMRPDRIVVGEVRGGEALDMLQAMNTGHDGSMTTGHANSPRDVLRRLETMTMMAGMELPVRAIREQIASAMDIIIHQARFQDGSRKITHISEVRGMENDVIILQDIFVFEQTGRDAAGRVEGLFRPTGIRPRFIEKLEANGIFVPSAIFKPDNKEGKPRCS